MNSRKRIIWPNMKNQIGYLLKKCETCQIYNRKNISKKNFVTTPRSIQKIALDLIDMRKEDVYTLVEKKMGFLFFQ